MIDEQFKTSAPIRELPTTESRKGFVKRVTGKDLDRMREEAEAWRIILDEILNRHYRRK